MSAVVKIGIDGLFKRAPDITVRRRSSNVSSLRYSSSAMDPDLERLSLSEMIQLQQELAQAVKRRCETELALMFTDVVGSTEYFQKFGDDVGRGLQQRHLGLVNRVLGEFEGTLVDTAGDGAFSFFPTAEHAASAAIKLQKLIVLDNHAVGRGHELSVRAGIHFGPVLKDGEMVSGDAVNLCARVAALGAKSQIIVTRMAFWELANDSRLRCQPRETAMLKGISEPVEVMLLDWRDDTAFPERVYIEETDETVELDQELELITFGRLRKQGGRKANDIVLRLPEDDQSKMISRWHFQLKRHPDGYRL